MVSKIYVNLPVKDLQRSKSFFGNLGFKFDPRFSDDKAACVILGENICAMIITEDRFGDFTELPLSDAKKQTEVLNALTLESRQAVDEIVKKALENGGSVYREPDDYGWMYMHSFADPDGHRWEVGYMDESAMPEEYLKKGEG